MMALLGSVGAQLQSVALLSVEELELYSGIGSCIAGLSLMRGKVHRALSRGSGGFGAD